VPSRDREGALPVLKIVRNEESHGSALRLDYVLDGFADIAVLP
jgi:hypothetical protein